MVKTRSKSTAAQLSTGLDSPATRKRALRDAAPAETEGAATTSRKQPRRSQSAFPLGRIPSDSHGETSTAATGTGSKDLDDLVAAGVGRVKGLFSLFGAAPVPATAPVPSLQSESQSEPVTIKREPVSSTSAATSEPKPAGSQNIAVTIRVRPLPAPSLDLAVPEQLAALRQQESEQAKLWTLDPNRARLSLLPTHPARARRQATNGTATDASDAEYDFTFDHLHLAPKPTQELYDKTIQPVVQAAMDGYNGTVFAYGMTASGKTHTMAGSDIEPGIISLAVNEVFDCIARQLSPSNPSQTEERDWMVRVSYLEIYNETLKDLLAPANGSEKDLKIKVDSKGRIYVTPLTEEIATSPDQVLQALHRGETNRHVGATDWNERSSRSHTIVSMTIESCLRSSTAGSITRSSTGALGKSTASESPTEASDAPQAGLSRMNGAQHKGVRLSQLNLIDLAGSERAASQDERRKEGAFINKSLLALSTVIEKLSIASASTSKAQAQHIPYRDSKLTRLLQTSLSGNARIAIVCAVSPEPKHALETLSTLKFARRAKMIVTKAEKGMIFDKEALLQRYQSEIAELKARLAAGEQSRLAMPGPQIKQEDDGDSRPGSQKDLRDEEELSKLAEIQRRRQEAESAFADLDNQRTLLQAQIAFLNERILTGSKFEATRATRASDDTAIASHLPQPAFRAFSLNIGRGPPPMRGVARPQLASIPAGPEIDFEAETEMAKLRRRNAELTATIATRDEQLASLSQARQLAEQEQAVAIERLNARLAIQQEEASQAAAASVKSADISQRIQTQTQKMMGIKSQLEDALWERTQAQKKLETLQNQHDDHEEAMRKFTAEKFALVQEQQRHASVMQSLQVQLEAKTQYAGKIGAELATLKLTARQAEDCHATAIAEARRMALQQSAEEAKELRLHIEQLRSEAKATQDIQARYQELQLAVQAGSAHAQAHERAMEDERSKSHRALEDAAKQQKRIEELQSKLDAQQKRLDVIDAEAARVKEDRLESIRRDLRSPSPPVMLSRPQKSVPSSPLRPRQTSSTFSPAGTERSKTVRESRRFDGETLFAAKGQQDEIDRLNKIIEGQKTIELDLRAAIAQWKEVLEGQNQLIAELATTTPVDSEQNASSRFSPPVPTRKSSLHRPLSQISINASADKSSGERSPTKRAHSPTPLPKRESPPRVWRHRLMGSDDTKSPRTKSTQSLGVEQNRMVRTRSTVLGPRAPRRVSRSNNGTSVSKPAFASAADGEDAEGWYV
ncbi:uncharacterized protein L969DRAFT_95756 [Mixia osmundae IAM 14324]|uniref:Kinesin motor domain-containing protein n=1 Tax=Mixia osmundae (strain CBS 9802 / IAM 14324 / JCM 22182 / KY 12970) TaxID=764103 RepID=G7DSN8_MIXOS|nr:uncharacterized protein L969DRAFT_95756 [Mixia osmundae IAM 14324]KEI37905.1 hypothetical protein L969DRAFT_95756 [Mixia osmundae IAM 14324]GAA93598.1 hypothetical protein E5Q_00242 [Mixia osmundae IAM 14324]